MENRRVVLIIAGEEDLEKFELNIGILQGSPQSSVLFITYIANMFEEIDISFKCNTISFTDNYTILIKEKDPERAAKEAEKVA